MARDGLRMVVASARRRGAEEGAADAVERARKPLVRRAAAALVPRVTPAELAAWKVARMARAIGDMDGYGFGGTDDVQAE